MDRFTKLLAACAAVGFMFGAGIVLDGDEAHAGFTLPPVGYNSYLTYIANGDYDWTQPHSVVPGCGNDPFCDSDYFQTAVQGRSAAEIDALEAQAKQFYIDRFDIDVDDPAMAGRVLFQRWTLDPRGAYRAYVVSGRYVPRRGFEVRDGGWALFILDPAGVAMGNEWAGTTAPAGSFMLVGEYNIAVKYGRRIVNEINIAYRSGGPVNFGVDGNATFNCDLRRGRLDDNNFLDLSVPRDGLAQGFAGAFTALPSGNIKWDLRNTLTFNNTLGGL